MAFDSCIRIKNQLVKPVMIIRVCVMCDCVCSDVLFGSVYDTFCGEGDLTKSVFLEMLFDYVTNSK